MPYAITLRADPATAAFVAGLADELARRGISRSQLDLGYPAHITLAIHDAELERMMLSLPGDLRRVPLSCVGLGIFAGSPCCLWLVPVMTEALHLLHGHVLSSLPGTCHPHYRPDAWVPHITLADDLPDAAVAADAIAAIGFAGLPRTGTLDSIELVRFPPVEILWSVPLDG